MCYSILFSNLPQKKWQFSYFKNLNPEGPLGSYLCDITLPPLLVTCQFLFCGQESKQRIFNGWKKSVFSFFSAVKFINPYLSYVPLQGSFSGAISQYSRIFLQEIASKFLEWEKNRTHFAQLSSYFAHAVHFKTIGLLCLTGFWIIVAPKFITHTTAGNHSLICIIKKLYRKRSLSVCSLSKCFLSLPRVNKNMSANSEKIKEKIIRPKAVHSG